MTFASGSLVRARGREWVVLPESTEELLILRPLGGTDEETAGIYLPLENVEEAHFDLPDPTKVSDFMNCRLLRDAVRIGFRNSAGPFRSFGKLAVQPRPYQLVPLLMALRLDPIRLLIADDVGIGKTIEACLIVREMIDRGEITRFTVLCPAHLAEQWQDELSSKFNLQAALVLPSTVRKLESNCTYGQSVFEKYPYTVVSMDYIKSDRHRSDFQRACPEMVVVDEVHGCAQSSLRRSGRHQRHQLVSNLAQDQSRNLILVTATPHSGKEEAFRSILAFLKPQFANLPEDLTGPQNESQRRELARYFIQRTRGDITHYLNEDTTFPNRKEAEESYLLHPEYMKLFNRVLEYTRQTVGKKEEQAHRQRVRYWSALALLRSLASSPTAAASTLRKRANVADTQTTEEADELGKRTILDMDLEAGDEAPDISPGSNIEEITSDPEKHRRKLLSFAREAESLKGKKDFKLQKAVKLINKQINDGHKPIVFCRFIDTAKYVTDQLRDKLSEKVTVECVTGELPPAERETRVEELAMHDPRVLVCTDCLSEGINLQEWFNAIVHYDLSWNPMRHEQRAGRVDRFGQSSHDIWVATLYGEDNGIDTKVLEVLLRKHRKIKNSLGISVPVPARTNEVIEALMESLLTGSGNADKPVLTGFEEYMAKAGNALFEEWESVSEREKRSRTMFAQQTIKPDIVKQQLDQARESVGSQKDVAEFFKTAVEIHNGVIAGDDPYSINISESPQSLRDITTAPEKFRCSFNLPVQEGITYLSRTHPYIENLGAYIVDTALDPEQDTEATRRCGAIRTTGVDSRTTLLLVRFRFHIKKQTRSDTKTLLAEDCSLLAFKGSPGNPEWLTNEDAEQLLSLKPTANTQPDQASHFVGQIVDSFAQIRPAIEEAARTRAEELLDAHKRVRKAARAKGYSYGVEPKLPADVLGVYVFLPDPGGG